MEADFSGYATKAGLKCADGLTIGAGAFKHQDGIKVPLVWQHAHGDPGNVLGHAILKAKGDDVYAYGYFNETKAGQNAKALVRHQDITSLSIYANKLLKQSQTVLHGMIREVSLVLSGANPGALIDFVSVQHSDGEIETLDNEAVIYMGLPLKYNDDEEYEDMQHAEDKTVQDVYDSLSEEQKNVVHFMIGAALEEAESSAQQSGLEHADLPDDPTIQDIYDSFNEDQKNVVHYMIGAALEGAASMKQSDDAQEGDLIYQEGTDMGHNVFESDNESTEGTGKHILSHADVKGIVADAIKLGSLRDAVDNYAVSHGIEDIDLLFPEAKLLTTTPQFNARRVEWVAKVLKNTSHTPFSRVKTIVADITQDEARAKGYIKGTLKKEEWFGLTKRTTSPTTIYKKQSLDRDDVVDITDFDVVAWLKGEMRLMLEEEIARAILIGDGRDVSNEDKIKDPIGASDGVGVRSIVNDHELFVTTLNVNVDDANSSYEEVIDGVLDGMEMFRGTGTPDFYTTLRTINMFLKSKDTLGRRFYSGRAEVAAALGVGEVIPVEAMNNETDLLGIIVNLADYNVGADKGGEVSLFDDFDIDYNKQKYLIETRLSGALTKIKSAVVVRKVAASTVLAVPPTPAFNASTNTITIPTDVKVVYKIGAATQTQGAAVVITEDTTVVASPAAGFYFTNGTKAWTFNHTE